MDRYDEQIQAALARAARRPHQLGLELWLQREALMTAISAIKAMRVAQLREAG